MSISDKLTTIANNMERVYSSGYEDGADGRPYTDVYAGCIHFLPGNELYYDVYGDSENYDEEASVELKSFPPGTYPDNTVNGLIVPISFGWDDITADRIKRIRMICTVNSGENNDDGSYYAYVYPKDIIADGSGGKVENLQAVFDGYYEDTTIGFDVNIFFEVYEEKIEGVDRRCVSFDDWHSGMTEESLIAFEHGLGVAPRFVAIIADDVEAVKSAVMPDGIVASIVQSDRLYNPITDEYYNPSYVRYLNSSIGVATLAANFRLISGWDDTYVYVNSAGSTYAWAPESVTTYTMICSA